MDNKNNINTDDGYNRLENLIAGNEKSTSNSDRTAWAVLIIIGLFVVIGNYFFWGDPGNIKSGKQATAKNAIQQYVRQTYGNELDRFETRDYMAEYYDYSTVSAILFSRSSGYGIVYYAPWLGNEDFTISYNLKNGEIDDRYRKEYLTGQVTFDYYSNLYSQDSYSLEQDIYNQGRKDNIFSNFDKIKIGLSLTADPTSVYMEYPQTDPEKEYDINQLADAYGKITLTVNKNLGDYDDFKETAVYFRSWLDKQNIRYANVAIKLKPTYSLQTDYWRVILTRQELASDQLESIIDEKHTVHTTNETATHSTAATGIASGIGAAIGHWLAQII